MKPVHKQIGQLIKIRRIVKDMTQAQLAEKLGYDSPQFVHLFEKGSSKVPVQTLGKLIVLLDLPESKIKHLLVDEFHNDLMAEIEKGKAI